MGTIGSLGVGKIIKNLDKNAPRAYIVINGLEVFLVPARCSEDLEVIIKTRLPDAKTSERERWWLPQVSYDSKDEPLPKKVQELIHFCRSRRLPLILGCDAKTHHIVWRSSDINCRGEVPLQFLVSTKLSILNWGREPTFYNSVRREMIDLTLCSEEISWFGDWRISTEPSLSD